METARSLCRGGKLIFAQLSIVIIILMVTLSISAGSVEPFASAAAIVGWVAVALFGILLSWETFLKQDSKEAEESAGKSFSLHLVAGSAALIGALVALIPCIFFKTKSAAVIATGVVGIIGFGAAYGINYNFFLDRRFQALTNTCNTIILAIGIFVIANVIGFRRNYPFDWTTAQTFEVSETTRNMLKRLKDKLYISVLMMPSNNIIYRSAKRLLDRFQVIAGDKIEIEYLDPEWNLERAQELVKKYNATADDVYGDGVIVFDYAGKHKYVKFSDMAEYETMPQQNPYMRPSRRLRGFKGEAVFSSAIKEIMEGQVTLCFLQGHGEKDPDASDRSGYSRLADVLKRENFKIEKFNSATDTKMPKCDVLIIAGPQSPIKQNEIEILKQYLQNGGRMLVLYDAVLGRGARSLVDIGLKPLLSEYGVTVNDDIVLKETVTLAGIDFSKGQLVGKRTFDQIAASSDFGYHPITAPLKRFTVQFPRARSLGTGTPSNSSLTVTALVNASDESWAETNVESIVDRTAKKDEGDKKGPFPLAIAVGKREGPPPGSPPYGQPPPPPDDNLPRLVVVGDADFVSNPNVAYTPNLNFFLNCVNWLANKKEFIGAEVKPVETISLSLDENSLRGIKWLILFGMPFSAIVFGAFVWVKRRN